MATRPGWWQLLLLQTLSCLTFVAVKGQSTKCRFPENVYTRYDWLIHDSEPRFMTGDVDLRKGGAASFKDDVVVLKQTASPEGYGTTTESIQFVCTHTLPDNKYLLLRDDSDLYICVQFLIRDVNVIQWRVSTPSTTKDVALCSKEAGFKLWESPFVYYHDKGFWVEPRNEGVKRKVCPLEGGYVASWTTTNRTEMNCAGAVPPLKVENECIIGEGMWIHEIEKNQQCPMIEGILYYRVGQKHICLAHWQHEDYEFMLLVMNHYDKHVLCARVPLNRGDIFDMYVFPDGTCYGTPNPVHAKYIRVHLERHVVSGECGDESPACPDKLDACNSMTTSRNCRETCGICASGSRYTPQSFPDQYQGKWLRPMLNGEVETWYFAGSRLVSSSMGTFTNLGVTRCSKDGQNRAAQGLGPEAEEYLLFSSFDNGCSPRFTSLSLTNRSESVVSYKISDSQPGNINTAYSTTLNVYTLEKDLGWNCIENEYVNDNPPLVDKYRKTPLDWFNLVKAEAAPSLVSCDFRIESLTFKFGGVTCPGQFINNGFGKFEITGLNPRTCSGVTSQIPAAQKFYCLAKFEGRWGQQFLITETPGGKNVANTTHMCWITSLDKPGVLFWHPAGDCDSTTELYFNNKRYTPLATLSGIIFTSACVQPSLHAFSSLIAIVTLCLKHLC